MSLYKFPRLFLCWLALFPVLYGMRWFLFRGYLLTGDVGVLSAFYVSTPAVYATMAYLYFRGIPWQDWSHRLLAGFVWIALSVAGFALLIGPVYGGSWQSAINGSVLQAQAINFVVIILVGWILGKHPHLIRRRAPQNRPM